jgi:5-methylcytosine-specific restriction protein A
LIHETLIPRNANPKSENLSSNQTSFDEGFIKYMVREFEVTTRNQKLVSEAKKRYDKICSVCDFDFSIYYGEYGAGFIEMHHLKPIKEGPRNSTINDLRPVCSNCHRMLHKGDRLLSIEELKQIIKEQRENA